MQRAYYSPQEVAGFLGISKQTLLRYEKKRIFPRPKRNPINRRREYSGADVTRLKEIIGRA